MNSYTLTITEQERGHLLNALGDATNELKERIKGVLSNDKDMTYKEKELIRQHIEDIGVHNVIKTKITNASLDKGLFMDAVRYLLLRAEREDGKNELGWHLFESEALKKLMEAYAYAVGWEFTDSDSRRFLSNPNGFLKEADKIRKEDGR